MTGPPIALQANASRDETLPVLFRCSLDEQPMSLLPRPALAKLTKLKLARELVLNRYCSFSPWELRSTPFLTQFSSLEDIVWVLDPDANALRPFWLGLESRTSLAGLQPGEPGPAVLPVELARALVFAGVLVDKETGKYAPRKRAQALYESSVYFQKNRYVPLHGLIHPFHIAALRSYIRELMAHGRLVPGASGYRHCLLMHNESVTRFFHHQLTSTVSKVIGEDVQPSFVFICSYDRGAKLAKHTDREQCEFSLSLCVDFIPEPDRVTSWPLYIHTRNGDVRIQQALGDGVLFCGRELSHFRHRLADGLSSTSILFHFVRRNFDGDLD
jgi:hypothetical protein